MTRRSDTLYHRRRRRRLGVRGGVAIAVIALAVIGVALLNRRAGGAQAAQLAEYVQASRTAPEALAEQLARGHRLLVVGAERGSAQARRLAAGMVERLAERPGLDAVAVDVPSDVQPVLDRYLNTTPEDASLLLETPRALGAPDGEQSMLQLYHRVWQLNSERGPARRIRIVALDLPAWPASDALSPRDAARLYARRDAHMDSTLEAEVLSGSSRARVLAFVGGYHAMQNVSGELLSGGGDRIRLRWFADRLRRDHEGDVATILLDGTNRPGPYAGVALYRGTRAYAILQGRLGRTSSFGVPVDEHFDRLRDPVLTDASAGLTLQILPADYRLSDVADGYVFMGS